MTKFRNFSNESLKEVSLEDNSSLNIVSQAMKANSNNSDYSSEINKNNLDTNYKNFHITFASTENKMSDIQFNNLLLQKINNLSNIMEALPFAKKAIQKAQYKIKMLKILRNRDIKEKLIKIYTDLCTEYNKQSKEAGVTLFLSDKYMPKMKIKKFELINTKSKKVSTLLMNEYEFNNLQTNFPKLQQVSSSSNSKNLNYSDNMNIAVGSPNIKNILKINTASIYKIQQKINSSLIKARNSQTVNRLKFKINNLISRNKYIPICLFPNKSSISSIKRNLSLNNSFKENTNSNNISSHTGLENTSQKYYDTFLYTTPQYFLKKFSFTYASTLQKSLHIRKINLQSKKQLSLHNRLKARRNS